MILFAANYLGYRLAVRFFNITRPSARRFFFIFIFIFLSLSLPLSRYLVLWRENPFTRDYYILANFWLGYLALFLMAGLLIWLIAKICKFKKRSTQVLLLSSLFYIGTVVLSAYGLWNAFHPRVKKMEIPIAYLPQNWRGKIIVQLSDLHLGLVHRPDFMQKIADETNALHPDLIVITGDLFTGTEGDIKSFLPPLNRLCARRGIFFVTGNHEVYLGLERVYAFLSQTPLKVLEDETVNVDGLQIVGLGYSSFFGKTDIQKIIQSLPNFKKGLPSILLYHTPTNVEQAKASGIHLQLSGHTHKGQFFLVELFGRLIYKKYFYGLNRENNFSIYTSSGVGTVGPPMRIHSDSEIVAITLRDSE